MKDLKKIIAQNIRERRRELGLSQEDIAKELEVTRQNYNKMEQGNHFIRLDNFIRIAEILQIDINELIQENDEA